jgi:TPR repeat protein
MLVLFVVAGTQGCGDETSSTTSSTAKEFFGELDSPAMSLAELTKKAGAGDAKAQNELGWEYFNGKGVAQDYSKAAEWFQKAAIQGNAGSQLHLGIMFANGSGVPKDTGIALEWYEKAAAQGNALAQYNVGVIYYKGEGVTRNINRAVEWFKTAAAQGDANAQYNLGVLYYGGEGVPKDFAKAIEWYQKAAIQGNTTAQSNLGLMYYNGEGFAKDDVVAYAWVNLSASQGSESAINNRSGIEADLTPAQLAEAQRLSSNWKKGQILVREGGSGNVIRSGGTLSKRSTGTIFVVSKAGQAITNQHVTNGCTELRIQGRNGVAKMITEDVVNDLALIQMPAPTDAAAIASDPGKLRQGEDVVVFGFPLNSILSSGGNLTLGVVSALTGMGNNTNQIQITAPIQPGSSGSPVLNKKGEVVGVVSMKLSDTKMVTSTGSVGQNVNFAVNGQTLKTFLDTHKVNYSTGSLFSREKSTADLADEARKWTFLVECWR